MKTKQHLESPQQRETNVAIKQHLYSDLTKLMTSQLWLSLKLYRKHNDICSTNFREVKEKQIRFLCNKVQ